MTKREDDMTNLYVEPMTIRPMPASIARALNPSFVSGDDMVHAVVMSCRVVREKGHSVRWEG